MPAEELATIHCAARARDRARSTPEEIAVSVLAEMIAVRRGVAPAAIRPMKMELPGRLKVGR